MRGPLHAWVSTIRLLFIPHVGGMTPQHAHPGGVPIRTPSVHDVGQGLNFTFLTSELSVARQLRMLYNPSAPHT